MALTSNFGYSSTARDVLSGIDLAGKTALVTGAASGIGVETARALALAGSAVTLAVRSASAGKAAAAAIAAEAPSVAVEVLLLDLADLSSVRSAAGSWCERHPSLDILINNAGVMACPLGRTNDGFELQMGTNHLGHFALFEHLLPALRSGDGARVVALSSSAHRRSDIVLDDLNYEDRPYDAWEAYGQSKTANALFAVELSQRFGGEGIWANAVMPGGILTGLQRHMSIEDQREAGFVDDDGTPNPCSRTSSRVPRPACGQRLPRSSPALVAATSKTAERPASWTRRCPSWAGWTTPWMQSVRPDSGRPPKSSHRAERAQIEKSSPCQMPSAEGRTPATASWPPLRSSSSRRAMIDSRDLATGSRKSFWSS